MIVKNPLALRKIMTADGKTPPGSIGWGYCQYFAPVIINDAGPACRMWPAEYNAEKDAWIVTDDGYEMKEGRIVANFPLDRP